MTAEQADAKGLARQSFYAKQQLVATAKAVFQQLAAVLRNAAIYPAAHPFLLESADQLLQKIDELQAGRKDAEFYLVAGELFYETHSVPVDQSLSLLIEHFTARDVGGVIFKPGLSREEIVKFAYLMNNDAAYFAERGGVASAMAKEEIVHVDLRRVLPIAKAAPASHTDATKKPSEVFMDAIDTVKEIVHAAHVGKTANIRKMNTLVHSMVDNILDNRDAMMGLTSIKMYDEYTFAHSVNTSILAISLGTFLSFDKPQIAALGVAGLLHDIGKVSVPVEIINKPDKLTDQEWEVIKRHPIEGALILSDIPGVTKLAMIAAFEHHQHNNVQGYPRINDTTQQHPFSQIIAIADAYDALTAARVYYRVTTPPDEAIRIMIKKRGTVFDPILVKAFVNMIGIFPVGTLLKLDTDEVGLVVHQTRDLLRPRVLLLNRFDGSERESGSEVSLLETEQGRYKRTAVATIDPNVSGLNVKQYLD